jgi:hypothetical protein
MKTVFKIAFSAALAAAASAPAAARAETYWTPRDLLASTAEQRARIEARLGYPLAHNRWTVFVAQSGAHVDGYALFDDELGEHMPITFAVKVSPAGAVAAHEIVAYRESRGDEVRDERFRRQFVGKRACDPLRAGDDISAVSGATISSRAMAVGVKRALVLIEELVLRPAQAARVTAAR